jgi:hypothetical protein
MTQTPFDQLSKQYLTEFLAPLGEVKRQYEVPGEAKFVDVWFVPHPVALPIEDLGLLGQMARQPALFEPFRDVPTRTKVRVSVMKLVWVQEDERRKAGKEELPEGELPLLWILAATTSRPLLQAANVVIQPGWPTGVYFMGDLLKTAIVAIDQLPVVPETLLLRILGRDDTQKQAIEEVIALPVGTPQRRRILRLVASWKVRMDMGELEGFIEREEIIMTMSQAFINWEEETRNEGAYTEARSLLVRQLTRKFGSIDDRTLDRINTLSIKQLESLGEDLLDFGSMDDLTTWLETHG